jgi:hypothetical protein
MARFSAILGPKYQKAIMALMLARSVEEASRMIGIPRRTLYRWLKDPQFQEALRQAQEGAFSQSMARLECASALAVTTQINLLGDRHTPASVKAHVADSVLNLGMKARDREDRAARAERAEINDKAQVEIRRELLEIVRALTGTGVDQQGVGSPWSVAALPSGPSSQCSDVTTPESSQVAIVPK